MGRRPRGARHRTALRALSRGAGGQRTEGTLSGWRRLVPARWRRAERLRRRLEERVERGVLGGPFAGMRHLGLSYGSELPPKWLGTYELELHTVVEGAIARRPAQVLVLGAAEGYYAVGLALRLPESRVVAFEARHEARATIREMAKANGVAERIEVRGLCDVAGLRAALGDGGSSLVLCDLDGAEAVLLDPALVPGLARAELVVETHDCFVAGTVETLVRRFATSHDSEEIRQRARSAADAPELDLPRSFTGVLVQAMSERRPEENHWLHLLPR